MSLRQPPSRLESPEALQRRHRGGPERAGWAPARRQGDDGRDHHPHGYTMWLADGGVKGGLKYGAKDKVHSARPPCDPAPSARAGPLAVNLASRRARLPAHGRSRRRGERDLRVAVGIPQRRRRRRVVTKSRIWGANLRRELFVLRRANERRHLGGVLFKIFRRGC